MNKNSIIKIAKDNGWKLFADQPNNYCVIFRRDKEQINVWYTKMTIATVVDHPKQGRQQLYRKNITNNELRKLFSNPRTHTNKGYRNRILNFFRII